LKLSFNKEKRLEKDPLANAFDELRISKLLNKNMQIKKARQNIETLNDYMSPINSSTNGV